MATSKEEMATSKEEKDTECLTLIEQIQQIDAEESPAGIGSGIEKVTKALSEADKLYHFVVHLKNGESRNVEIYLDPMDQRQECVDQLKKFRTYVEQILKVPMSK